MKNIFKFISVLSLAGLLITGCSKLQSDIPTQPAAGSIVHGQGFLKVGDPNFHGNLFLQPNANMAQCKQCHGQTFGGGSTNVSCTKCHTSIDVHAVSDSLILNPSSPNFHGAYFKTAEKTVTSCGQCHGNTFQGKGAALSCVSCHPAVGVHSTTDILNPASANFHGSFVHANNWNLPQCQQCHGVSYQGGISATSCEKSGCHNTAKGPEACNTCHGNFADSTRIAPPKDVSGNTQTSARGVGAHTSHLYAATGGKTVACQECHNVPTSVFQAGHLDAAPNAEIKFNGPVGNKNTAIAPAYNSANQSCANTYCHGNFAYTKSSAVTTAQYAYTSDKIEGSNFTPKWTSVDASQMACGTCHALPPKGHVGYNAQAPTVPQFNCGTSACHAGIVDANNKIIDPLRHINGDRNLLGK